MKTIMLILIGFVLILMVSSVNAKNHKHYQHPWADWYAQTAVAQAHEIHKLGCFHRGDRWSYDYYKHLHWASRHSQNKANYEIQRRNRRLLECSNSQHHYAEHRVDHRNYPRPHYKQNESGYWQSRYSLFYSQPYNGSGGLELGLVFKY